MSMQHYRNRYLVFAGSEFDAAGGACDLKLAFQDRGDAKREADRLVTQHPDETGRWTKKDASWSHVLDVHTLRIIYRRNT